MLTITIPVKQLEQWDENTEQFVYMTVGKEQTLQLEHSLVSISKWESKWHRSFLHALEKGNLTHDETVDYIKCMTLTKNVDSDVYEFLTEDNMKEINAYISDSMTATTINDGPSKTHNREILTSELIYYCMVSFNIPFECEKWHINRLLMLIRVCSVKNQPTKKMSRREIMNRNAAINAARRKQINSKG